MTYAGNLANLDSVADNPQLLVSSRAISAILPPSKPPWPAAIPSFILPPNLTLIAVFTNRRPSIETNVTGTFVLLQVARKLNIQRFVHISTDEVYGDMAPGAFADENSPFSPAARTPLRKQVRTCSSFLTFAPTAFPAVITRASNNYGPYQFPEKFLPLMITNALDGKPLPIYGDGKQQRDWLHVRRSTAAEFWRFSREGASARFTTSAASMSSENITMARRLLRAMGKT